MSYVVGLLIVGVFSVVCGLSMLVGFIFNWLFDDLFDDERGEDKNDDNEKR